MSEPAHLKPRVDDDDLDDLDDILDQFSTPPQPNPASAQPQPAPTSSSQHTDGGQTDDFARELEKGMESLFRELGIEPPAGSEQNHRLQAAWEAMLVEGMDGIPEPNVQVTADGPSSPRSKGADFQSKIRTTMDRLRESESGFQSSDSPASGGDMFDSLLSQLGSVGDGNQDEEQLQGVLEAMMGQLMSKEVLYEPLKELHEKFPGYLVEHSSTISPADKERFEAQIECIRRLLDEFEAGTYRDNDDKSREKVVDLMSELQSHGSPPEEIIGPLPPGFSMGEDGLPNMPSGCGLN